jgi:hypothetical protein
VAPALISFVSQPVRKRRKRANSSWSSLCNLQRPLVAFVGGMSVGMSMSISFYVRTDLYTSRLMAKRITVSKQFLHTKKYISNPRYGEVSGLRPWSSRLHSAAPSNRYGYSRVLSVTSPLLAAWHT